jgi:hypothetical protein
MLLVVSAIVASGMYELEPHSVSLTRSLLEGMDSKKGVKGANLTIFFLFLPSCSGSHVALSHQVQQPKTV